VFLGGKNLLGIADKMSLHEQDVTQDTIDTKFELRSFRTYCESTAAVDISVEGFMRYFPEKSSPKILGEWTGSVLPYLRQHSDYRKSCVGTSLNKVQHCDILKAIEEELRIVCSPGAKKCVIVC
jgi:hypothetical protein